MEEPKVLRPRLLDQSVDRITVENEVGEMYASIRDGSIEVADGWKVIIKDSHRPGAYDAMMVIDSIKDLISTYRKMLKARIRKANDPDYLQSYGEGMLAGLDMVSVWIEELEKEEEE